MLSSGIYSRNNYFDNKQELEARQLAASGTLMIHFNINQCLTNHQQFT